MRGRRSTGPFEEKNLIFPNGPVRCLASGELAVVPADLLPQVLALRLKRGDPLADLRVVLGQQAQSLGHG